MFQITKPILSISVKSALGDIVFSKHDIHYVESLAGVTMCVGFSGLKTFRANAVGAPAVIRNYFHRYGVFSVTIEARGQIEDREGVTTTFNKPRILAIEMRNRSRDDTNRFMKLMQAQLDSMQELSIEIGEELHRQTGRTTSFVDYLPEGQVLVVEREIEKTIITRLSEEVGNRTKVVPIDELVDFLKANPDALCWTEGGNPQYYKRYILALTVVNNHEDDN